MFSLKLDQEHENLQDLRAEQSKSHVENKTERENFQKNIQILQKSLQDKVDSLKEKEESNSILRKEALDLVARYLVDLMTVRWLRHKQTQASRALLLICMYLRHLAAILNYFG